jgi:predicted CoA-binding protein
MNSFSTIQEFFKHKNIAVVGVSSTGKGFGYLVFQKLKEIGYNVYPVNKNVSEIEGNTCYSSLNELHGKADSAIFVIPPGETISVIDDAHSSGIKNIWFQPGSESADCIKKAQEKNLSFIKDQCVLMFVEPVNGFHKVHRFVNKIIGKYPSRN